MSANRQSPKALWIFVLMAVIALMGCQVAFAESDPDAELSRLNDEGLTAYRQANYLGALKAWKAGLANARSTNNRRYIGGFLVNIGIVYARLGQLQQALHFFRQALDVNRELDDRYGVATALTNIGGVHSDLGHYQQALDYHRQALAIHRERGDYYSVGATLTSIGDAYLNLGQYQEALDNFQQALNIAHEGEDRREEGKILSYMGLVYDYLGQYQRALEFHQQALSIHFELSNPYGVGIDLSNIGVVYHNQGQYRKTLDYYQQTLIIAREIGDRHGEGSELSNIGTVYKDLGQYQKALEYYQQALAIRREISDRRGKGIDLGNIGAVYAVLGQYQKALEYYQQALAIRREIGDRRGEALHLGNIGVVYQKLGQYQLALIRHQRALAIRQEIGDRHGEGAGLANIGSVYGELGQHKKALDYFQQALAIHRKISDRHSEGVDLDNIGTVYRQLGQFQMALEYYQQALAIQLEIGAPESLWKVQNGLALVKTRLNHYSEAIAYYKQALDTIEMLRGGLSEKGSRLSYMRDKQFVYDNLITLLLNLYVKEPNSTYHRQALKIFERKQGRVFLEEIGQSGARRFAGLPEQIVEREMSIGYQLATIQDRLAEERSKPLDRRNRETLQTLETQLKELSADRKALETHIQAEFPDYYALKYPVPAALNELQTRVLQPGEIILIYSVMEDHTDLWIVSRKVFQFFALPVGEEDLQEQIGAIRLALGVVGLGDSGGGERGVIIHSSEEGSSDLLDQSYGLYKRLFPEPARSLLAGNQLLYIVPTGPLYALPFEILATRPSKETPHYLIEDYPIAYLSSISLLKTLRDAQEHKQSTARYSLLAFADPVYGKVSKKRMESDAIRGLRDQIYRNLWGGGFPELPETAEEAKEIARLFQAPVESDPLQLREQAARSKVLEFNEQQRLDDYRYLLFATHGILPGEIDRITQPALVLTHPEKDGSDGFLTMADVFGLELNAELVSLSACNTGMGERIRGEGVLGLSRAFMYAGTPAVAMTLWSVESLSAKELSVGLFRHLKKTSQPAEALRQIKLEMLRGEMGETYRHPRYWAPLVVFGDAGS